MSQAGKYLLLNGGSAISTLTGNSGLAVGPNGSSNIDIVGSGIITVVGNPATNTLTISSSASSIFTWNVVTDASQNLVANNGYIANNAGVSTMTLPAVATVGDTIKVTGMNNATGWKVAQNAGQSINISTVTTTVGASGYLQSSGTSDCIELLCIIANTGWQVISVVGNITYV